MGIAIVQKFWVHNPEKEKVKTDKRKQKSEDFRTAMRTEMGRIARDGIFRK